MERKMTIYLAKTTFGSFRFKADFAQASCNIYALPDRGNDESEGGTTPYQVADARHDPARAARMLLEYFGRQYWCDPDCVGEDDDGNETFDGLSKDDYLDSLIVSVEAEDC
jgi:hypothetical protein